MQEDEMFSQVDGFPRKPFPHSCRGKNGLYAAGFTRRGIIGTSYDPLRIASDIADHWTEALASPTAAQRGMGYDDASDQTCEIVNHACMRLYGHDDVLIERILCRREKGIHI
jgi:hypothetical protein